MLLIGRCINAMCVCMSIYLIFFLFILALRTPSLLLLLLFFFGFDYVCAFVASLLKSSRKMSTSFIFITSRYRSFHDKRKHTGFVLLCPTRRLITVAIQAPLAWLGHFQLFHFYIICLCLACFHANAAPKLCVCVWVNQLMLAVSMIDNIVKRNRLVMVFAWNIYIHIQSLTTTTTTNEYSTCNAMIQYVSVYVGISYYSCNDSPGYTLAHIIAANELNVKERSSGTI